MCEKRLSVRCTVSPFVMLFALLLLMGISLEPVFASTWQIETIDSVGATPLGPTSLALDPTTGHPRISYAKDYGLMYAVYYESAQGGWKIKTVDSAVPVKGFTSLALDPRTGHPRISYTDMGELDLRYAAYNGRAWEIETVDSAGDIADHTSLALDPRTGRPRISYIDQTNNDLKYAAYLGSGRLRPWRIETIDSPGRYFSYSTSLALDPTMGHPRISYFNIYSGALKLAVYWSFIWSPYESTWWPLMWSGWRIWTIDSARVFGVYPQSLALDPTTGHPRISYIDQTTRYLMYGAYNGDAWEFETVDSKGIVETPSLALDPNTGYPRISYIDLTNSALKFASYNGNAWKIETVDSVDLPTRVTSYPSLALDPNTGYPRISYVDQRLGLKYASLQP